MKCVSMELSWNLAAVELQSYEPQGCELTGQPNGLIELLASERSERDTYRGNTIENRGCLFI